MKKVLVVSKSKDSNKPSVNIGQKESNPNKKRNIIIAVVAILFLFIIFLPSGDNEVSETEPTADALSETDSVDDSESSDDSADVVASSEVVGFSGGQYRVGSDMPAGEYVIIGTGYLEIASDSSGSFESIVENDNYSNRTIVSVADGQYIKFSGRAYSWDEVPVFEARDGKVPDGRYKVGVDIPAGEYKIEPRGSGYYEVSSSAGGGFDGIVTNENFDTDRYLAIQDGHYLKLNRATLRL